VALAQSGRAEVAGVLEELKEQPLGNTTDPSEWRRSLTGSVVDAAFWSEVSKKRGAQYVKSIYGTEQAQGLYTDWLKTEDGRKWWAWYQRRKAEDTSR
jgi:hypothetical protein